MYDPTQLVMVYNLKETYGEYIYDLSPQRNILYIYKLIIF